MARSTEKISKKIDAITQKNLEKSYQQIISSLNVANDVHDYEKIMNMLLPLDSYKDCDLLAAKCQEEIDRMNRAGRSEQERKEALQNAAEKKRKKRRWSFIAFIFAFLFVAIAEYTIAVRVIIPNRSYNDALAFMDNGDYESARNAFLALDGYKDAAEQAEICRVALENLDRAND